MGIFAPFDNCFGAGSWQSLVIANYRTLSIMMEILIRTTNP
jgi:hypothetical protein